jgi:hypothetical protein
VRACACLGCGGGGGMLAAATTRTGWCGGRRRRASSPAPSSSASSRPCVDPPALTPGPALPGPALARTPPPHACPGPGRSRPVAAPARRWKSGSAGGSGRGWGAEQRDGAGRRSSETEQGLASLTRLPAPCSVDSLPRLRSRESSAQARRRCDAGAGGLRWLRRAQRRAGRALERAGSQSACGARANRRPWHGAADIERDVTLRGTRRESDRPPSPSRGACVSLHGVAYPASRRARHRL